MEEHQLGEENDSAVAQTYHAPQKLKETNFEMLMGEEGYGITWHLFVVKTPENEEKWAHFFEYFPFKLIRWD